MSSTTEKPLRWSVAGFERFWSDPNAAFVAPFLTPDVVGYWPGRVEPVRGRAEYTETIAQLIAQLPGMYLEVAEQATNGEFVFIRWVLHASGDKGPFEIAGIDRVRLRDGLVAENVIVFDSAELERASGRQLPWAGTDSPRS